MRALARNTLIALTLSYLPLSSTVSAEVQSKLDQQPASEQRAQNAVQDMDALFTGAWTQHVTQSTDAAVVELLNKAKAYRKQANEALTAQDFAKAIDLSDQAKTTFLQAAQAAKPKKSQAQLDKEGYQQRMESINSMMDAFQDAEQANDDERIVNLRHMVEDARKLAAANDHDQANQLLDKVSIAFKAIITTLMQGATVTAEKDTTPKGLYEYEVFRNDTYLSLIEMLHEKEMKVIHDPEFKADIAKGHEIRKEALAIGATQDYEAAMDKLAKSTNAYKSAVRTSGLPIPD